MVKRPLGQHKLLDDPAAQAGSDDLPLVLSTLLYEMLLRSLIPVMGKAFLDIFCGEVNMTLATLLVGFPSIAPWDTRYGESSDVLKNGEH